MQRDVIIVGGGLAGIMAAFSAQAEGAEVLLIDRGSIGVGTNSILAGGVFAAPTSIYGPDAYIKDTLQVGKMINNEPRVKLIAKEAPGAIDSFSHHQTPFKPKEPEDLALNISQADKQLKDLSRRLKEMAWKYAGVVRTDEGIKMGMKEVELLDRQLETNVPHAVPERKLKEDLMSASFLLKAVLTASLAREESRGSFNRRDFPQEDNINWQKNSCLIYDRKEGRFSLTRH